MTIVLGIDIGSASTKALLYREDGKVVGRAEVRTRANFDAVAREALAKVVAVAGIPEAEVSYVAATGLGRYSVSFRDVQITEMTAAGRGAFTAFPGIGFVLDMGAQSTRAIRLREDGKVREFHVNEKCAAGSGSFLVRAAKYLEVPVAELGTRSLQAQGQKPISSVCAVLAESEIINHVSEGVPVNDVIRGLHESLVERAFTQLKKVGLNGPVAFVGGVAIQEGAVAAARRKFGVEVRVPDHPNYVTALGAAVLGLHRLKATRDLERARA